MGMIHHSSHAVRSGIAALMMVMETIDRCHFDRSTAPVSCAISRRCNMSNNSVLLIEPDRKTADSVREILELSGYQVVTEHAGLAGKARALLPDTSLVLCSAQLPDIDPYAILDAIRLSPPRRHIPFLLLIDKAYKVAFRKGMDLGADDFITKPCDAVELIDVVALRLAKAARIAEKMALTDAPELNPQKGKDVLLQALSQQTLEFFQPRDYLYREGQTPRHLYHIEDGQVKVFRTNEIGKDFVIRVHGPGSIFGHQALIEGKAHRVNAVAIEPSQIRLLPQDAFLRLLAEDADLYRYLIGRLADDMCHYEGKMLSIAYDSVRKRIATALLELYHREGIPDPTIALLREDLSNMVGTAKESVSRTLSEFKSEQLIDLDSGTITILHEDKLAKLIN